MTFYARGDYNGICDTCGGQFKFSELRKRWDGLYVCRKDYEVRHPQDLVRGGPAPMSLRASSPEGGDTFIDPSSSLLADSDDVILWGENPDDILRWS